MGPHQASDWVISRRFPAEKLRANGTADCFQKDRQQPNSGKNSPGAALHQPRNDVMTTTSFAKRKKHKQHSVRIAAADTSPWQKNDLATFDFGTRGSSSTQLFQP